MPKDSKLERIIRPELEKIINDALEQRALLATSIQLEGLAPKQKRRLSKRVLTKDAVKVYINEVRRRKRKGNKE